MIVPCRDQPLTIAAETHVDHFQSVTAHDLNLPCSLRVPDSHRGRVIAAVSCGSKKLPVRTDDRTNRVVMCFEGVQLLPRRDIPDVYTIATRRHEPFAIG